MQMDIKLNMRNLEEKKPDQAQHELDRLIIQINYEQELLCLSRNIIQIKDKS